jgi:hypothetical protein
MAYWSKKVSQPLKAGESTPKIFSGEISNIIRLAYPAFIALAASVMVHQPGKKQ